MLVFKNEPVKIAKLPYKKPTFLELPTSKMFNFHLSLGYQILSQTSGHFNCVYNLSLSIYESLYNRRNTIFEMMGEEIPNHNEILNFLKKSSLEENCYKRGLFYYETKFADARFVIEILD